MSHRTIIIVQDPDLDLIIEDSFLDRRTFSVRTAMDLAHSRAVAELENPEVVVVGYPTSNADDDLTTLCRDLAKGGEAPHVVAVAKPNSPKQLPEQLKKEGVVLTSPDELLRTLARIMDVRVRTAARVAVQILASVELTHARGHTTAMMGNVLSLSATGMRLELGQRANVDDQLGVKFFLPRPQVRIHARCRVCHLLDPSTLCYAVEFLPGQDALVEEIEAFIKFRIEGEDPNAERQNPS